MERCHWRLAACAPRCPKILVTIRCGCRGLPRSKNRASPTTDRVVGVIAPGLPVVDPSRGGDALMAGPGSCQAGSLAPRSARRFAAVFEKGGSLGPGPRRPRARVVDALCGASSAARSFTGSLRSARQVRGLRPPAKARCSSSRQGPDDRGADAALDNAISVCLGRLRQRRPYLLWIGGLRNRPSPSLRRDSFASPIVRLGTPLSGYRDRPDDL